MNALGKEKYTKAVRASPGLTAVSKGVPEAALRPYRFVINCQGKSRAKKDDILKQQELAKEKELRQAAGGGPEVEVQGYR